MEFRICSLKAIYVLVNIIVGSAFSSVTVYVFLENLFTKAFSFEDGLLYASFMSASFIQIMPAIAFVESKKFADYFNDWADFQVGT